MVEVDGLKIVLISYIFVLNVSSLVDSRQLTKNCQIYKIRVRHTESLGSFRYFYDFSVQVQM